MKIILDTHIFLWSISNPNKIDSKNKKLIQSLSNSIYISSISITEIMIKSSIGKLSIDFNAVKIALKSGFELLEYKGEDALLLKDMPFYHKDPFDRMIIAQSINNNYSIITNDKKFKLYDCKLI